jgi:hypothetical protein
MERDQQGDHSDESLIRILKNREFGEVGEADTVTYNRDTGRLVVSLGESVEQPKTTTTIPPSDLKCTGPGGHWANCSRYEKCRVDGCPAPIDWDKVFSQYQPRRWR